MIAIRMFICMGTMTIMQIFFIPFGNPPGRSISWFQYSHEIMRVEPVVYEAFAVLSVVPAALIVAVADWINRKLVTSRMLADVGAWTIVMSLIIAIRCVTITYGDLHPEDAPLFVTTHPDETLNDIVFAITPYYVVCLIVGCILLALARNCHNRIFKSVS